MIGIGTNRAVADNVPQILNFFLHNEFAVHQYQGSGSQHFAHRGLSVLKPITIAKDSKLLQTGFVQMSNLPAIPADQIGIKILISSPNLAE